MRCECVNGSGCNLELHISYRLTANFCGAAVVSKSSYRFLTLRRTDILRSALGLRLGSLVGERVQPDLDETANERVGALRIQSLLHLAGMVSRDDHHFTCIGSSTCIISLRAHGVLTRDARGEFGSRRLRVGESLTS